MAFVEKEPLCPTRDPGSVARCRGPQQPARFPGRRSVCRPAAAPRLCWLKCSLSGDATSRVDPRDPRPPAAPLLPRTSPFPKRWSRPTPRGARAAHPERVVQGSVRTFPSSPGFGSTERWGESRGWGKRGKRSERGAPAHLTHGLSPTWMAQPHPVQPEGTAAPSPARPVWRGGPAHTSPREQ